MSCETDCNAPWDRLLTNMIVQKQGSPQKPSTSIQKLIGHAHSSLSWTYSKNPLFGNLETVSNSNMLVNIFLLNLETCTISYKSVNNESATQRPIAMNRVKLTIPTHLFMYPWATDTLPLPSICDQSKELKCKYTFPASCGKETAIQKIAPMRQDYHEPNCLWSYNRVKRTNFTIPAAITVD